MFSKLFNKNKKENVKEEKETFSINNMEEDGKHFILRFKDKQLEYAKTGKYPFQIGIAVPLNDSQNGFPTKEENEQLLIMEQILEKAFNKENTAILVGAIMGNNMKEFILYTGDHKKSATIFEKLKDEIKHHKLQCMIREDPSWELYKTYHPEKTTCYG